MDDPSLLVSFAQYIVKRGIGKINSGPGTEPSQWYCACCTARLKMSELKLDIEKDQIPHKTSCLYLQAKAVLLLHTENKDG